MADAQSVAAQASSAGGGNGGGRSCSELLVNGQLISAVTRLTKPADDESSYDTTGKVKCQRGVNWVGWGVRFLRSVVRATAMSDP